MSARIPRQWTMRWTKTAILLAACAALGQAQSTRHLTLAQAEQMAIQNHPRLAEAQFNASAAAQAPLEVRAGEMPQFSGSFSGTGADNGSRIAAGLLNNPILYSRIGTGFTLSQLITDFGRTSNLYASSQLHAQAQNQDTQATREQILLEVNRAYFGELRAEALLKVAQQTVAARQLVADQVAALAKSNLKSTLDVSFANVNLSDAKLLLASAQNNVSAAQAELATALGLPGQAQQGGFTLSPEPMPAPLPDTVQPLISQALQDRPDAAALKLEQNSAERFAKAERALYFPTISAAGSAGLAPVGVAEVPERYGAFGLNVNVPVFNGHLFKARRTEAELRAQQAAAALRDLQNRIGRDVRVAYLNATTSFQRMSLTAQLLQEARLAGTLAQSRYDLGLGSIVELSQAQLNVTSAEIENTSAQYDYQLDRANLSYQIGALR
jgi:outer membrane protein